MNELLSLITDVDILINGKPVRKYSHKGKVFIEAREGSEYSIKVKNGTSSNILAIAGVDGINVLDGKAAGSTKAGYVLYGWNSYEIKGFRTSNDGVNAFKFAKRNKSYAAKSDETGGDTSNCGVIGVQFYAEKPAPVVIRTTWIEPKITWHSHDEFTYGTSTCDSGGLSDTQRRSYNASSNLESDLLGARGPQGPRGLKGQQLNFCASVGDNTVQDFADFDLGTEFSKKEIEDKVRDVEFEIGSLYNTFEIYYASRESLLAMGVQLEKSAQVAFPKAFPTKFCKPPRD